MKKIILIITTICIFGFDTKSHAQDTLKVKLGFFFVPQGVCNLEKTEDGLSSIAPILAVVSFNKGKSVFNIMYNMTFNKVQLVYAHQISSVCGMYLLSNKSALAKGGYSSIGVTRSVMDGKANAFLEFGSGWTNWGPTIYAGAIIPLVFRIK